MSLEANDFLIEDNTSNDLLFDVRVDGEVKGRGYVERDYNLYPPEMFDPPDKIIEVPQSEWSDRIKYQVEMNARLSDVRATAMDGQPFPALDQNGQGFCWCYSSSGGVMIIRAINHQPYKRLSAHGLACKIKNFKDEGGWCGLSLKGYREIGCPTVGKWPEKSMDRSNDKPEVWEEAAQYKVTEEYADLTRDVWAQNITFNRIASCLLQGIPVVVDFNWWGHSVLALDLVEVEAGSFGLRILNSWSDQWGEKGTGVLRGEKAKPNGAVAIRSVRAAA
jgi:hypothetical protein